MYKWRVFKNKNGKNIVKVTKKRDKRDIVQWIGSRSPVQSHHSKYSRLKKLLVNEIQIQCGGTVINS